MSKIQGRTVFITGASRGIGRAIGLALARQGAQVVIASKTDKPHPKLPGTIHTAAEEMRAVGGKALPVVMDVRFEEQVEAAIQAGVDEFGGIDFVINNASAIFLAGTLETPMKRYDLMHSVNSRGTYLVSKAAIPHLRKSSHPHVLNISPPLNMDPKWFANHPAYTLAKYGMSVYAMSMAREFQDEGIAFNTLWPRTTIDTAAIRMLKGEKGAQFSRLPEIMADAAIEILRRDPRSCTGNFFVDEEVLTEAGQSDFSRYRHPGVREDQLIQDYFLD